MPKRILLTLGLVPTLLLLAGCYRSQATQTLSIPPTPSLPGGTPTRTPTPTQNAQGFSITGPFQFKITTTSGQQYAHHVLSQGQPGQTAFAGIVVHSDYVRNFFADAHALGYDPSLHGASSAWDQGAGWYCLTSGLSQDAVACTFASALLRQSFNILRPLGYWNREGSPGTTVYSAFGVESVPCCSWPPVTGNFTVYYIWHSYASAPTPTPATPLPATPIATPEIPPASSASIAAGPETVTPPSLPTRYSEFSNLSGLQKAAKFQVWLSTYVPGNLPFYKAWIADYADGSENARVLYSAPGDPLDANLKSVDIQMTETNQPVTFDSITHQFKLIALDI
ncbi:MAG: hypothetical protein ABSB61_06330 [Anaerolineales bacterium]|jgi:hypothetical protein